MPPHQAAARPYLQPSLDSTGKTAAVQPAPFSPLVSSLHCRGIVKIMLELGSIDLKVVQDLTHNTPLLMMMKVITRDGPNEVEVAGAAAAALVVNAAAAAAAVGFHCRFR
jgi:hypothetical protein